MGFGSKIFTLEVPHQDNITAVINGEEFNNIILKSTTSPYIAKYTDSAYKQIVEARKNFLNDLNTYWNSQPELKEPAFLQQMLEAEERENNNSYSYSNLFRKLCKYRLNKKVPNYLPFEERKSLFVQTSEWNGKIRQTNKHLKENELTPENIQVEIDQAGVLAGLELYKYIKIDFDRKSLFDAHCEIVLDKGNVRYDV